MIEGGCIDILQPDAVLVGGITGLARIARTALQRGLAFTPHTWGNGIGLLANAHLAAGVGGGPWLEYAYDFDGFDLERRDFMLSAPIRVGEDGILVLSETPGLGIELDEDRLQATARTQVMAAPPSPRRPKGVRRVAQWLGWR
jgi:L-alanine-DL-glutamate epimerase-like enolase superfamily enzyme